MRAPICNISAYWQIVSKSLILTISVTTLRPTSSATERIIFKPSTPSPWKSYGDVRGLKAPPRKNCAPHALTALAASNNCSRLSTEQGPAITAKWPPPIFTPSISITLSSFLNSRLTNLYFSVIDTVFSTPEKEFICNVAIFFLSPITPTITLDEPCDKW